MPASGTADLPVAVEIAQNSLSVRVSVDPELGIRPTDAPLIIAHLMKMGVVLSARGEAEIRELCRPRKSVPAAPPALVAVGTAAVDDVPAHLTLLPTIAGTLFEAPQVKAGAPVATLVPRCIGADGVDVFGKPIPRRQAAAQPVVDASLYASADGKTFYAAIDGVVRTRGEGPAKTIFILPCVRQEGELTGGSLVSPGEISVRGDVRSSTLRAGGAIHVIGDMENSTAVGDNLLTASALRGATVDVAGDVVASEIFQSRISCGGEVNIENGAVIGGRLIAAGGLRCKSLGAPPAQQPGVKTIIEIGTDDRGRKRMEAILPEIEAKIAKATKIRQTVEPLLRGAQSLTPQQQLRVATLLGEADTLDEQSTAARQQLRVEYDSMLARCRNEISISQIVHPGVTIRFPGAQTTVRIAIKGPCRIVLEMEQGQPRILLLQAGNGPIPLELSKLTEEWRAAAKRLAACLPSKNKNELSAAAACG